MKSFKQYLNEKMGEFAADVDYHPEAKLGPKATKLRDKVEIARQKKHLTDKATENHTQSEREGGGGAAEAKAKSYENARDNIKEEGMTVAAIAGTGDSRLPAAQREPGVSKKRNPNMSFFRRKQPKV